MYESSVKYLRSEVRCSRKHLFIYVSAQVPTAFKFFTRCAGNILYYLKSEKELKGLRQRLTELRLTFRKAFFSKVFMINGGMAAREDRAI